MSGVVPSLPLYTFMPYVGVVFTFLAVYVDSEVVKIAFYF